MGGIASPKHERIEKELLLLRNLPMQYKLGQKKTALGRVIYVSLWLKPAFMQREKRMIRCIVRN